MELTLLSQPLAVCRLPADAPLPGAPGGGAFYSVTRTAAETSIVCAPQDVPPDASCRAPWRALRLAGPLDFAEIGILAELTAVLAAARISVFALSTFDTDYLLVEERTAAAAASALRAAGHAVVAED